MPARDQALSQKYDIEIKQEVFNDAFFQYLYIIANWEVYYGGSGTGKSTFVGQKLALQMSTIPGRNLICLRSQAKDCRDSCFAEIYNALRQFKLLSLWRIREHPEPRMVNRINGNEMWFTGLDDIENIKSVKFKNGNATDFWYEEVTEETNVENVRELDRRLRDPFTKSRIILTFNPVNRAHWLFDFVTKELVGTDCIISKTTYRDNKFIKQSYRDKLERYKYTDPYAYQVYALGEWGTMGQTVFNANQVSSRLMSLRDIHEKTPPRRIEFKYELDERNQPIPDSFRPFEHSDGEIVIYEEPIPNYPYVLAFDTAGEGSDFYAGQVMNNVTGVQAATFHSPRLPDVCVLQLFGLANYYNTALVCPEMNFDQYPLKKFQELGYSRFYRRMSAKDDVHETKIPKYGFLTGGHNRQNILTDLVSWAAIHINCLNDPDTLNEMLTFTRQNKRLKGIWWGAEPGTHDDLIMALAICLQAREQQMCEIIPEKLKISGTWTRLDLEFALQAGKIDNDQYREFLEQNRVIGHRAKQKGASRYAR